MPMLAIKKATCRQVSGFFCSELSNALLVACIFGFVARWPVILFTNKIMYCVLCSTTSAIAAKAAVMSVRPVLKKSTSSAVLQIAKPSCSPCRLLVRQPSITAPLKNSGDSAAVLHQAIHLPSLMIRFGIYLNLPIM